MCLNRRMMGAGSLSRLFFQRDVDCLFSFIKILLSCSGMIVFVLAGYYLYSKELGAIPFLLLSFFLFYLAYRLMRTPGRLKTRDKNSRKRPRG